MEPMAKIALRAARSAAKHILRGFDRPDLVKTRSKGNGDLVTNIDTEAEAIIADALRKKYPKHRVTGEESGSAGPAGAEYEWLLDPLDGTKNFARQLPHFCISIGCRKRGRLEHGIVLDPIRQEEFVASRGQGATLNGRRMRVSGREGIAGATIAFCELGRREPALDLAVLKALTEVGALTRQPGSAALDLAYVAAGRLDGLWQAGLSPWDYAAGALLVTEAGGLVGDFTGSPDYAATGNLVAGTPHCFKPLTALVKRHE